MRFHLPPRAAALAATFAVAGATAALAQTPATGAEAGPPRPDRVAISAEAYFPDNPDTRDIRLNAATIEYERNLKRPAAQPLAFGAMVSLHGMSGTSVGSNDPWRTPLDATGTGVSASVFARVYALQSESFAFHMEMSAGGLWTREPWPPGGSDGNGIFRFGFGADRRINGPWGITGGFRYLHVSNGGGLVASNPAYDSLGGYLGITREIGTRPVRAAARRVSPVETAVEAEAFPVSNSAFDTVMLDAVNAVYEYHLAPLPISLLGSGSSYFVDGSRPDPNVGLGLFNAGGVGQSLNAGARIYLMRRERFAVFVDAQAGGVIGGRFTRAWPFGDEHQPSHTFVNPLSWTFAGRAGAGVKLTLSDGYYLSVGYRTAYLDFNRADTSDYHGHGIVLGLSRRY